MSNRKIVKICCTYLHNKIGDNMKSSKQFATSRMGLAGVTLSEVCQRNKR